MSSLSDFYRARFLYWLSRSGEAVDAALEQALNPLGILNPGKVVWGRSTRDIPTPTDYDLRPTGGT